MEEDEIIEGEKVSECEEEEEEETALLKETSEKNVLQSSHIVGDNNGGGGSEEEEEEGEKEEGVGAQTSIESVVEPSICSSYSSLPPLPPPSTVADSKTRKDGNSSSEDESPQLAPLPSLLTLPSSPSRLRPQRPCFSQSSTSENYSEEKSFEEFDWGDTTQDGTTRPPVAVVEEAAAPMPEPTALSFSPLQKFQMALPPPPTGSEPQPVILLMDSLAPYHGLAGIAAIFRDWLIREWCARKNGGQPLGGSSAAQEALCEGKGSGAGEEGKEGGGGGGLKSWSHSGSIFKRVIRDAPMTVPKQDNGCDCGVFILRFADSVLDMLASSDTWGRIPAESFDSPTEMNTRSTRRDKSFRIPWPHTVPQFSISDIAITRSFMNGLIMNLKEIQLLKALSQPKHTTSRPSSSEEEEADQNVVKIFMVSCRAYMEASRTGLPVVMGRIPILAGCKLDDSVTNARSSKRKRSETDCLVVE